MVNTSEPGPWSVLAWEHNKSLLLLVKMVCFGYLTHGFPPINALEIVAFESDDIKLNGTNISTMSSKRLLKAVVDQVRIGNDNC